MTAPSRSGGVARIRIWDAPVRLFHWLIVALVAAAWWTAQNDQMGWHKSIGYAIASLLAFRVWWGFVGSSTARFSAFVRGPRAVAAYARNLIRLKQVPLPPGHNPIGGWSVLALLGILIAIVGFGLFCVDVDGVESGPLASRISFDAGRLAAHWHQLLFNGLLALIALHLCAIAFYALVKRDNLIGPMLTGAKRSSDDPASVDLQTAPVWALIVGLALALALGFGLSRL